MLLTDYSMFYDAYLTKSIRENFHITKYIISKDICPELLDIILAEAPWYQYECLLDIKKAAAEKPAEKTGLHGKLEKAKEAGHLSPTSTRTTMTKMAQIFMLLHS